MAKDQDTMAELSENMTGLSSSDATTDEKSQNKPLAEKSSYYYAHNSVSPEGPKTLVGAQTIYNHKPLGQDEVQKLALKRQDSEGESAWNSGGTWEEKDFSKVAEKLLKEDIKGKTTARATFTEVNSVEECHCGLIFSRGKKRQYLEIEKLEVKWEAKEGKGKGKVEVTELSSSGDADDVHIKVTIKKAEKEEEGLSEEERRALEKDLKATGELFKQAVDGVLAQVAAGAAKQ
mmetsp:Transcript_129660/g.192993  ORF Transcript_129660/g.192993 Transcript_129660/m.192993 type:complete len:233 (+) Transcript_129660:76-774(+)